jgi:hypothetical protein
MKNEHEEQLRKLLLEAVEIMANHVPYGQFTEFAEKVNKALKRHKSPTRSANLP